MFEVVAVVVDCRSANKKERMEQEEKEREQEENKGGRSAWGEGVCPKLKANPHCFAFSETKVSHQEIFVISFKMSKSH
jgi:hypothetical protein